MKRLAIILAAFTAVLRLSAETFVGVQLFDMYKAEKVFLMTPAEFTELKANLSEEKSVFGKAVATVKKDWEKQFAAARKAGDKDFPKYPTKPFIFVRTFKSKTLNSRKAADEWFAKQQARVNADMVARVNAAKQAQNAAKNLLDTGYSSRDEKKARKKAEKADMDAAVKDKLGELVELQMSTMLKFNRPIPRHYAYDPLVGPDTHTEKKMAAYEKAFQEYQARKAAGTDGAEGGAAATAR